MARMQCYIDGMTGRGPFQFEEADQCPNILVISMDMVPGDFYGPGRTDLRTPHLDEFGEQHLTFARAFTTSPLCAPARAAYLTGRHSYITTNSERAHDGHAVHLRADDIIFPEYLKAAGYHVRHVGKCHVGAETFARVFSENASPWNRWSPPWFDDDAYGAYLHRLGLRGLEFARVIQGRSLVGTGPGNSYGGWIAPQQGVPFPTAGTYPAFLAERAIEALAVRPDPARPFYLQLDFFAPHQPFAIPGDMAAREEAVRAAAVLPPSYREYAARGFLPARPEPRVYELYRRNWGLQDPQVVLDYRVANQLQFELVDAMVGRVLHWLRDQGLYDDTWVFVLADHGEMNGECALIDKGAYLHPRVVRVPLWVKPAAGADPGRGVIDSPVSLLDLAPTVLEVAGVSVPARLDGHSLLAAARGSGRPPGKPILFEVWSHVIPNPCVGTVFTGPDGAEYLFAFNASDPVDEIYRLADRTPRGGESPAADNLWRSEPGHALTATAVRTLHGHLAADPRWRSYRGFLELTYPHLLAATGDRQLFV